MSSTDETSTFAGNQQHQGSQCLPENARKKLLLLFVHGFCGSSEKTFGLFPDRLSKSFQAEFPAFDATSQILPTFQTLGNGEETTLDYVVQNTINHLGNICKDFDRILLIGHSMGGIVAVDALNYIFDARCAAAHELSKRNVGVLALDTPYYGLNGKVEWCTFARLSHGASQTLLPVVGSLFAISKSKTKELVHPWRRINEVPDHLHFVSDLMNHDALDQRRSKISQNGHLFQCFYNARSQEREEGRLGCKGSFVLTPPEGEEPLLWAQHESLIIPKPLWRSKVVHKVHMHTHMFTEPQLKQTALIERMLNAVQNAGILHIQTENAN